MLPLGTHCHINITSNCSFLFIQQLLVVVMVVAQYTLYLPSVTSLVPTGGNSVGIEL